MIGSDARPQQPRRNGPAVLVLEAGRTDRHYWRDLWHYRELFIILAWRDLSVRYKQTVIGVGWAIVRPLLTMIVFTIIFGRLAGLPSEGTAPYTLLVFAGMLPWFLFSSILTEASSSLLSNANLLSKVYFPRLVVPTSACVVAFVDFAINLALLAPLMLWYGFAPDWRILLLPVFIVIAGLASLGPALLIASFNVQYRDFRYIIPFIVQFGLACLPAALCAA